MIWTDINWNPAKAILPYLLTGDTLITASWHKSPRLGSGSTRLPLRSKQQPCLWSHMCWGQRSTNMPVKLLGDIIARSPLQKRLFFLSLPEQRKIDRGGRILYGIQRRVEWNDSGLHTSTFNGAVTVKCHNGSYGDFWGNTENRSSTIPFSKGNAWGDQYWRC